MDSIAIACKLDENGIGAMYSIECEKTYFLKSYDFNQSVSHNQGESIQYKDNLFGIYCTAQRNTADEIATAAIRAGSVGPTVVYGQGRGIRDRLGLLRIAISPEKEMIRVVVDNYDTEPVFEAMIQEGRLDTPGMGFIYIIPIQKGIVNIPSTTTAKNELASRHQMIKAIDEIQGGSSWRIQSEKGTKKQRKYLSDLKRLTCVVNRGQGKESGGGQSRQGSSITVNRELEIIELIVSPDAVDTIIAEMLNTARLNQLNDLYFYTQPVPKALTYLG
jgi:nitrogen regulatory protein PII